MELKQEQAYEIESLGRTYTTAGAFSEPFLTATFVLVDVRNVGSGGSLDINGIVPLPANIPITFDCRTLGVNISNIQVLPPENSEVYIVVYFTKYRGFVWAKES